MSSTPFVTKRIRVREDGKVTTQPEKKTTLTIGGVHSILKPVLTKNKGIDIEVYELTEAFDEKIPKPNLAVWGYSKTRRTGLDPFSSEITRKTPVVGYSDSLYEPNTNLEDVKKELDKSKKYARAWQDKAKIGDRYKSYANLPQDIVYATERIINAYPKEENMGLLDSAILVAMLCRRPDVTLESDSVAIKNATDTSLLREKVKNMFYNVLRSSEEGPGTPFSKGYSVPSDTLTHIFESVKRAASKNTVSSGTLWLCRIFMNTFLPFVLLLEALTGTKYVTSGYRDRDGNVIHYTDGFERLLAGGWEVARKKFIEVVHTFALRALDTSRSSLVRGEFEDAIALTSTATASVVTCVFLADLYEHTFVAKPSSDSTKKKNVFVFNEGAWHFGLFSEFYKERSTLMCAIAKGAGALKGTWGDAESTLTSMSGTMTRDVSIIAFGAVGHVFPTGFLSTDDYNSHWSVYSDVLLKESYGNRIVSQYNTEDMVNICDYFRSLGAWHALTNSFDVTGTVISNVSRKYGQEGVLLRDVWELRGIVENIFTFLLGLTKGMCQSLSLNHLNRELFCMVFGFDLLVDKGVREAPLYSRKNEPSEGPVSNVVENLTKIVFGGSEFNEYLYACGMYSYAAGLDPNKLRQGTGGEKKGVILVDNVVKAVRIALDVFVEYVEGSVNIFNFDTDTVSASHDRVPFTAENTGSGEVLSKGHNAPTMIAFSEACAYIATRAVVVGKEFLSEVSKSNKQGFTKFVQHRNEVLSTLLVFPNSLSIRSEAASDSDIGKLMLLVNREYNPDVVYHYLEDRINNFVSKSANDYGSIPFYSDVLKYSTLDLIKRYADRAQKLEPVRVGSKGFLYATPSQYNSHALDFPEDAVPTSGERREPVKPEKPNNTHTTPQHASPLKKTPYSILCESEKLFLTEVYGDNRGDIEDTVEVVVTYSAGLEPEDESHTFVDDFVAVTQMLVDSFSSAFGTIHSSVVPDVWERSAGAIFMELEGLIKNVIYNDDVVSPDDYTPNRRYEKIRESVSAYKNAPRASLSDFSTHKIGLSEKKVEIRRKDIVEEGDSGVHYIHEGLKVVERKEKKTQKESKKAKRERERLGARNRKQAGEEEDGEEEEIEAGGKGDAEQNEEYEFNYTLQDALKSLHDALQKAGGEGVRKYVDEAFVDVGFFSNYLMLYFVAFTASVVEILNATGSGKKKMTVTFKGIENVYKYLFRYIAKDPADLIKDSAKTYGAAKTMILSDKRDVVYYVYDTKTLHKAVDFIYKYKWGILSYFGASARAARDDTEHYGGAIVGIDTQEAWSSGEEESVSEGGSGYPSGDEGAGTEISWDSVIESLTGTKQGPVDAASMTGHLRDMMEESLTEDSGGTQAIQGMDVSTMLVDMKRVDAHTSASCDKTQSPAVESNIKRAIEIINNEIVRRVRDYGE